MGTEGQAVCKSINQTRLPTFLAHMPLDLTGAPGIFVLVEDASGESCGVLFSNNAHASAATLVHQRFALSIPTFDIQK